MEPRLVTKARRWERWVGGVLTLLVLVLGGLLVGSRAPSLRVLPALAGQAVAPLPATDTPLPTATPLPTVTAPPTATALAPSPTPVPATPTPLPATPTATITAVPTVAPLCADAWEPNNTPAQARPIPGEGVIRDLTLCPSNDADYFTWTTAGGVHYVAQTFADAGLTPWLTVTHNGQFIGQAASQVSWDAPGPGTYLIGVTNVGAEDPTGLRYTLAVGGTLLPSPSPTIDRSPTASPTASVTPTPPPTEPPCLDAYESDGTLADARPILINDGPQARLFCPAGDSDWAWFAASRGKTYILRTLNPAGGAPAPGVDPYLYLFDSDGQTPIDQNDDGGGGGNARLDFTPQRDGRYYLQVKNKGDVGGPAAAYGLQITLSGPGLPTPSPAGSTATSVPTALPVPTGPPPAPPTEPLGLPTVLPGPPVPPAPGPSATPTPDPLLRIGPGDASTGGLAYIEAGPVEALSADRLEAHEELPTNDDWPHATPLDVGILYRHLNFVPVGYQPQLPPERQPADHDYYTWRTKPGTCYLVGTSNLTPGLDTTLQVLRVAPFSTPAPLTGADDRAPGSPDVASVTRFCSTRDEWLIAAVNLYGWTPRTDVRGRTYDFAIVADPPTPTPTRTPRPTVVPQPVAPQPVAPQPVVPQPVAATPRLVLPTLPPTGPTAGPTLSPAPPGTPSGLPSSASPIPSRSPVPGGGLSPSATPAVSPTPSPTATPVPQAIADLVCYVDFNGNHAPDPGEEIVGLRGLVVDVVSNQVITPGTSDPYGRLHLVWPIGRRVRVILPNAGPGWSHEIGPGDLQHDPADPPGTGHWQQNVEITPLLIPGVIPAAPPRR